MYVTCVFIGSTMKQAFRQRAWPGDEVTSTSRASTGRECQSSFGRDRKIGEAHANSLKYHEMSD